MIDVELQQVGQYITTQLLEEGSTSRYYLARHQQRKKDTIAVIKVLHTPFTTTEAKKAFLTRGELLKKKLRHRNIVEIQDVGFIQEHGYIAMQFVPGGTIRQRFTPGLSYPPDEVKRILSPLAGALRDAHVKNILHGNLHPGNILIGEHNDVLLTDFSLLNGILESPENAPRALPYRAPEHLRGTLLAASDQYSLAVLVYEWLCGRRPYTATDPKILLNQQETEPVPSPRNLNSNISPAVESVLLQALAPNPDERFPHTLALSDAYLRALMGLPMSGIHPISIPASTPTPAVSRTMIETPTPDESSNLKNAGKKYIAPSSYTPSDNQDTSDLNAMDQDAKNDMPESMDDIDELAAQFIEPLEESAPSTHNDSNNFRLHEIVTSDLRQGGILSRSLPGYEERPAQVEMATLVARSLMEDTPAIIEAGTGTGKSLAYLIPIVRSNKVAIISTANKALQEQLFYKDIPFVQKHIKNFDAALVKGMGNYVCLEHLDSERIGAQHYVKNRDFLRLLNITEDPDSKFTGDFETLEFQLPGEIRSRVSADSDQCAWSKCSFFSDCYVRKMRVKASNARVIVVNHTLLLLDALMDGYLLPERDVIVVDEAHHLEEEATRAFTVTVSQGQISSLLAQQVLKDHTSPKLQDDAKQATLETWERLEQVADPGYKGRANLHTPLQEGLRLATVIADLADSLRTGRPPEYLDKESQQSTLYDKLLKRTQNLSENIRKVFSVDQPRNFVYYVERLNTPGRRNFQLEVSAAPLDVTSWLKEQLFSKCNVICTSATLATIGPNPSRPDDKGPNFAYFRRRIGLNAPEYSDTLERILPLTFDYQSNALLYVPRHLPEPVYGPGSSGYTKAIAREMHRLVEASRGRAFLLFSSKRMLDEVYDAIAPNLNFPLLRQGDLPRGELTRLFRTREGAVLFGLKSFWEGVDIAGEALSLVVIDKMPFDPPDDPVHEARVALMKAAGENWFGIYVLPQAVLRLKQGLGRLLRTREDRGVMAILDARLHTKGYGRLVLNALPPARKTTNLNDVEQFFANPPV